MSWFLLYSRRLFLISDTNGFCFCTQHKNHATVYLTLLFSSNFFYCLACWNHNIHYIPSIIQLLIHSFRWNSFHFFLKSLSNCFIFESCLFILFFCFFMGLSRYLSFPLSLHFFCLTSSLNQFIDFVFPFSQRPFSRSPILLPHPRLVIFLVCCTAIILELPSLFSSICPLSLQL